MRAKTILSLILICPVLEAHAAVRVAPGRGVSVTPRAGIAGVAGMPGTVNLRPGLLSGPGMEFALTGTLPSVKAPEVFPVLSKTVSGISAPPLVGTSAGREAAAALNRRGLTRAGYLAREMSGIKKDRGPGGAMGVMRRVFDLGTTAGEAPAAPVAETGGGLRRPSLARHKGTPASPRYEPPAPDLAPPWLSKVWSGVKKTAAAGFGLYGGSKLGDVAYSFALANLGLAGLGLAVAGTAGVAYFLRRRALKSGQASLFYSTLLGTFMFTTVGQLLWDAWGMAGLGLGAGALLGVLAALYAAGLAARSRK
ncbi:MAG: hypothetical protein ABIJ96_01690 [Elusimicrobiota bacterium]